LAGIAYWINKHFRLSEDQLVTKHDWIVTVMKEEIDKLYADGRTTVMGEQELEGLFRRFCKDGRCSVNWFDL
jgi:hypothetical protein